MDKFEYSQIDKLLLKNGFVQIEDIDFEYQTIAKEKSAAKQPLGIMLVKEFGMSQKNLLKILNSPLLYKKAVSIVSSSLNDNQTKEIIKENNSPAKLLNSLERASLLDKKNKRILLNKIIDSLETAKIAILMGFIVEKDLELAMKRKKFNKSCCELLYHKHLVTLSELNEIFRSFDETLKLGTILKLLGIIDEKTLETSLAEQRTGDFSLGHILINKNLVSINQLYFALSIQYNIPFRPLVNFTYSTTTMIELRNIIKREFSEENLIIPILLSGNNLTLGIFNPSHMANINEIMEKYSHLKINTILITHNKFEQLYAILYGEVLNVNNDLIKSHTKQQSLANKTVISNPNLQYRLINDLFDRYISLYDENDINTDKIDREVFHSFINENFKNICHDFKCVNVSFWFEMGDGKINIKASPV